MLLTKFRTSATTSTPILSSNSSGLNPPNSEFVLDARERTSSNSSLVGSSPHLIVSNIANLAKTHILMSGTSGNSTGALSSNEAGPVYEIKQELLVSLLCSYEWRFDVY